MLFPRQFMERKARRLWNTRSCYSPLWLHRVTGNCFWFLDLPPVWKGLVCSPSLHLLLVFFLVVRRLPLQLLEFRRSFFFTGSVYGFLAIRSIRVDCWISKLFTRQTLELPTDRPTNRKSAKKLSDFRKSLHVQSRVLVKCEFWEAGFGFLCGAAWFRWSQDRRFDQRRTITYFGDPSGKTCRRPAPGYAHGQVRTHGQTFKGTPPRSAILITVVWPSRAVFAFIVFISLFRQDSCPSFLLLGLIVFLWCQCFVFVGYLLPNVWEKWDCDLSRRRCQ